MISGWDAASVVAKALVYAATLGAAGLVFFTAYAGPLLEFEQTRRMQRALGGCLILVAAASVAKIALLAGSMSDELAGMFDIGFTRMILRAGEGRALAARALGVVLVGIALCLPSGSGMVLSLAGAALLACSFAFVGHVHALVPNLVAGLSLCTHTLCAAFWLGALWPLLLVLRNDDPAQSAAVVRRFAKIAMLAVGVLLAAGIFLLTRLLDSPSALWTTVYGRLISLKLLLVVCLLAAAAVNKLLLTPGLTRRDSRAALALRRSIRLEAALAAAVLLLTAAFTTLTGPAA